MSVTDARVTIPEDEAEDILSRAGVRPDTFKQNPDKTFTATFEGEPIPIAEKKVQQAHPAIVIIREEEEVEQRQPNVAANLPTTITFAFTADPDNF